VRVDQTPCVRGVRRLYFAELSVHGATLGSSENRGGRVGFENDDDDMVRGVTARGRVATQGARTSPGGGHRGGVGQPPASRLTSGVTNVMASYS